MKVSPHEARFERRWPIVAAIFVVSVLLVLLPDRIKLVPTWINCVAAMIVLLPIAGIAWSKGAPGSLRIARAATVAFFVYSVIAIGVNLGGVIHQMLNRSSGVSGLKLLTSGVSMWIVNVFIFSLIYWQVDGGGPEARLGNEPRRPDFCFPQAGAGEHGTTVWRPSYIDYPLSRIYDGDRFQPDGGDADDIARQAPDDAGEHYFTCDHTDRGSPSHQYPGMTLPDERGRRIGRVIAHRPKVRPWLA